MPISYTLSGTDHKLGDITISVLPGGQTNGKLNTDDQDLGLTRDQMSGIYDIRLDDYTYYSA